MERVGSAVELRLAPKARSAAHPKERQHSAAEGGTRDRVRMAGVLCKWRVRRPASGIVTRMGGDAGERVGRIGRGDDPSATRPEPGPKGTH